MMIYGVVIFAVSSLLITRYSYICKKDEELRKLSREIAAIEAEIESKELDLSLIDDISIIEKTAKNELGMYYPDSKQIYYMDLQEIE